MKKVLSLLVAITSLALVLVDCNDNGVKPPVDPSENQVRVDTSVSTPINEWKMLKEGSFGQSLAGTSWKLFDVIGDQPNWWTSCYELSIYADKHNTIEFKEDGTITAYSCVNWFDGSYTMITRGDDVFCNIQNFGGTKVGGIDLWWDTHSLIKTFSVQEKELKLFYNDGKNCLLFKPLVAAEGQENRLIYPTEVPNAAEKAKEILQKSTVYMSVDFVTIDLEKINRQGPFTLQFGKRTIRVNKERVYYRSFDSYTFVGKNDYGDEISFSVLRNDIQGVIQTMTGVFSIMTVGENEYAVVQVDQSKLKDEPDDWTF